MKLTTQSTSRRSFLQAASGLALSLSPAAAAETRPLRGVFPIGQTPFTESNRIDLECLQAEVKFCQRFKVHGFAWPQIASGWTTLSEQERLEGAEAILAAGKGGRTALVIGVQDKEGSLEKASMYARHAAKNGADAIISLPPEKAHDQSVIAYYKGLGTATELPLMMQTQGGMSVDLVVAMFRQIPTMRCVKDEAGNPLARVGPIRERTGDKLAVFSGNGVRTMIDEMRLGFAGHCPFPGLSDFYAAAFDLWHGGKQRDAFDMFGRILAFNSIPGAATYIMQLRGVFKESTQSRPGVISPGGGRGPVAPLDEAGKRALRDAWDAFMKPHLRG